MKITTKPAFRFGWQGATLDYVVKADGVTELRVPEQNLPACGGDKVPLRAQITDVQRTDTGVQAHVKVDVRDSALVCGPLQLETRDAAGATTQHSFGTLMTVPACVIGTAGVVGAIAFTAAVIAIRRGGGIGWTLGILAALVALAGLGFVAFGLLGRFAGIPLALGPAPR